MRRKVIGALTLALVAAGMAWMVQSTRAPVRPAPSNHSPLAFIANTGQVDPAVRFMAHGFGGTVLLGSTEVYLPPGAAGSGAGARLTFLGGAESPELIPSVPLPGVVNYFPTSDPASWRTGAETHARLTYAGVWPGVDVALYGAARGIEYDFVVSPGVNPAGIRFRLDTGSAVRLDRRGNLVAGDGSLVQRPPFIYQDRAGQRTRVEGGYRLAPDGSIGFSIGEYDARAVLVIDPIIDFSTYLGGSQVDQGKGVAIGDNGAIYVTGTTNSTDFPTVNPFRAQYAPSFVTKFDSGGSVVYSTYFGPDCCATATAIAVDGGGNSFLTGSTNSAVFPVLNAFQPTIGGSTDAFVAKFSPVGALEWSTFLGGDRNDSGAGIAVDPIGNIHVTGSTLSTNFPVLDAFQAASGGGNFDDAFVTKFAPGGQSLVHSSYLGGSGTDGGTSIASDASGRSHITGYTGSGDFPTAHPVQAALGGIGPYDAFVTRVGAAGGLDFSTYLGGALEDIGTGIDTDSAGNAYVAGYTSSAGFPTVAPFQATKASGEDTFVTKFSGNAIAYSTFLGGNGPDRATGIAVDGSGRAFIGGLTSSTNFPLLDAGQSMIRGVQDGFVTSLSSNGDGLAYSTYLGGGQSDSVLAIDVTVDGRAAVTGQTTSSDFPSAQNSPAGGGDAFVARLTAPIPVSTTSSTAPASTTTTSVVGSTTTTGPSSTTTSVLGPPTTTIPPSPLSALCALLRPLADLPVIGPIIRLLLQPFGCA